MFMMINGSPDLHFAAAFKASEIACEMMEIFPETDLIIELSNILEIQRSIMECIIQRKHFGDDNIISFVNYCDELKWQIRRLGEQI